MKKRDRQDPRGKQKGAPQHDLDQHGPKTYGRFIEQLHSRPPEEPDHQEPHHDDPADERLFSHRVQHDEADQNSDKNRLEQDIDRHGHNRENFQLRGGAESHPVEPRSHIDPTHPDKPTRGGLTPDTTPGQAPRRRH